MNMSLVKINIEQACALVSEHFGLRHSERHPPVRSPSKEYDIAPYRKKKGQIFEIDKIKTKRKPKLVPSLA